MTRAMTARVDGGRGAMRRARRGRDHFRMSDTYCVGLGRTTYLLTRPGFAERLFVG